MTGHWALNIIVSEIAAAPVNISAFLIPMKLSPSPCDVIAYPSTSSDSHSLAFHLFSEPLSPLTRTMTLWLTAEPPLQTPIKIRKEFAKHYLCLPRAGFKSVDHYAQL